MNKILYTPFAFYYITAHHFNHGVCLLTSLFRHLVSCLILLFCHRMAFSQIFPYFFAHF